MVDTICVENENEWNRIESTVEFYSVIVFDEMIMDLQATDKDNCFDQMMLYLLFGLNMCDNSFCLTAQIGGTSKLILHAIQS